MDSRALERQLAYEHALTIVRRMEAIGILSTKEAQDVVDDLTATCRPVIPLMRLDCEGAQERPC